MASNSLVATALALAASLLLNACLLWTLGYSPKRQSINSETDASFELPDGWWSSAERFAAERRAIFSQTWMCVSHRGRFKDPGDYIVYEVAGFRFYMILGKDKRVRAFHNVCRHRAFPVARKDSGRATVLGCRFHGWSYDTTGRLTKAPYFDDIPGFDRSQFSLYEIHTKEDKWGFLHINPSTGDNVAASNPAAGSVTGRLTKITPNAKQIHSFERQGRFNWKLISGNDSAASESLTSRFTLFRATPEAQLVYSPLTTVHTAASSPFWYQLTYSPVSAEKTSVRCDVYSVHGFDNVELSQDEKADIEQTVADKVKKLEARCKTLRSNISPMSTDSSYANIASAVESHVKQERLRGYEIKPAEVRNRPANDFTAKADMICKSMECGDKKLEW